MPQPLTSLLGTQNGSSRKAWACKCSQAWIIGRLTDGDVFRNRMAISSRTLAGRFLRGWTGHRLGKGYFFQPFGGVSGKYIRKTLPITPLCLPINLKPAVLLHGQSDDKDRLSKGKDHFQESHILLVGWHVGIQE